LEPETDDDTGLCEEEYEAFAAVGIRLAIYIQKVIFENMID